MDREAVFLFRLFLAWCDRVTISREFLSLGFSRQVDLCATAEIQPAFLQENRMAKEFLVKSLYFK